LSAAWGGEDHRFQLVAETLDKQTGIFSPTSGSNIRLDSDTSEYSYLPKTAALAGGGTLELRVTVPDCAPSRLVVYRGARRVGQTELSQGQPELPASAAPGLPSPSPY